MSARILYIVAPLTFVCLILDLLMTVNSHNHSATAIDKFVEKKQN